MRRFYKLPFRKELLCRIFIALVSVSLLLAHGIKGAEARAAVQKPAAPASSALPTATSAPNVVDAATVVNTPATPAEAVAADVSGYRIVNGIAIYPILPGNETVVQGLLSALAQDPNFQGISMTLYAPIGTKPKILLSNQSEEKLRYAVQKLKTIMSRMGEPHRLVVAAYLREISITNDDTVGMSWFSNGIQGGMTSPNTTRVVTTSNPDTTARTETGYTLGLANLPLNVAASLTRSMSKGKVVVGSEITIVNGATAELKNDDSMPVPLSGANNQVTFNTQTISSDIKITPAIVQFNADKPEESVIRLDVVIQLSVPTNTVVFSGTSSASEYTTQTLTATHYVKANNEKIIGGLFASDTWTDSRSGVPILMNIPLLKQLFSMKTRSLQHMASILTLAVRILPVDKETGYDY